MVRKTWYEENHDVHAAFQRESNLTVRAKLRIKIKSQKKTRTLK